MVDESSQVSLPAAAEDSQTEVETLKQQLTDNQQVCVIITPSRVAASIESQSRPRSRLGCFIKVKIKAESRPACWLSSTNKFSLSLHFFCFCGGAQMKIAAYCSVINPLYTVHN